MIKDVLVIAIGFAGTLGVRSLLRLLLRHLFGGFLVPQTRKSRLIKPLDILSMVFCGGIILSLLFDQRWLLWIGLGAGALLFPTFLLIFYQAKRNPGSLAEWTEDLYQRAGKPMPADLREKFQQASESKTNEASTQKAIATESATTLPMLSTQEEALDFAKQIPELAERHRVLARQQFGLELNYEPASIPRLERMVREGWRGKSPAILPMVVMGFGSYLGETIRHIH